MGCVGPAAAGHGVREKLGAWHPNKHEPLRPERAQGARRLAVARRTPLSNLTLFPPHAMSEPVSTTITEVIICTTCRPPGASRDLPAAGADLFEAVQTQQLLHEDRWLAVRVRGMTSLSSCSRAC